MAGRPRKQKVEQVVDENEIIDDNPVAEAPAKVAYNVKSKFLMHAVSSIRTTEGPSAAALGGEQGSMLVGIECPFAFQYLIQNSCFPLELMTQIVGTEGTCKSALVAEIGRWFSAQSGYLALIENESKMSQDWYDSIIGYPDETGDIGYMLRRTHSVDNWQTVIQHEVDRAKALMEKGDKASKTPPLGKTFPVVVALDSIMGKLTEESQKKIETDGFAGRGFAIEALSITRFLKAFPQKFHNWPFAFVAVNHLKPQKAEGGFHTERNKAGGRHISFQESFEIEMSRDKGSKIRLVESDGKALDRGGIRLIISCKKNSFGETDRPPVHVSVLWKYMWHEPTQTQRQYTKWDWPSATIDILSSHTEGSRGAKIKEVVDVNKLTAGKYWSSTMGVSKESPVTKNELGQMIEADSKIVSELRNLLAIKNRQLFKSGDDYDAILDKVKKEADARISKL